MVTKKTFGGVRASLVGTLVAAVGGIALTACNSCCDPCHPGPAVYRKPCCAQSGGQMSCGAKSCGAKPAQPPPAGGGQMSCGAGKCG